MSRNVLKSSLENASFSIIFQVRKLNNIRQELYIVKWCTNLEREHAYNASNIRIHLFTIFNFKQTTKMYFSEWLLSFPCV